MSDRYPLDCVVIGAGRTRNGIGSFIARDVHELGGRVRAVMGATRASAAAAAANLERCWGIRAVAYDDFELMLQRELPRAAVIASPAATHAAYLRRCVAAGLHVLCEKPALWPLEPGWRQELQEVRDLAAHQGLCVAMNSQWPFSLSWYERLCGPVDRAGIESFYMQLAPACRGVAVLPDSLPHPLSMLYVLLGPGRIECPAVRCTDETVEVRAVYATAAAHCRVTVELQPRECQPRDLAFGVNGRIVRRVIDMADYAISFTDGPRTIAIEDPLRCSVENFLRAVVTGGPSLIGPEHMIATTHMLQEITAACAPEIERYHAEREKQGA